MDSPAIPDKQAKLWMTLALGLILTTTLVRILFVATGQLDLAQDEAQYWDWSRNLQLSYYSKGPLIAWLNAAGTAVFGNTQQGVRACAVLFSLLSQCAFFILAAVQLKRPRMAFWTLLLLNTSPLFMASAVLMTTDSPLLFFWIAGLVCLHQALLGEKSRLTGYAPLLLAACVALGVLAKYTMLVFVPLAFVFALAIRRRAGKRVYVVITSLLAGAGIGLLPIVIWNATHEWVSFRHVGTLAGVNAAEPKPMVRFDRFPEFMGGQIGILLPWWFFYVIWGGWQALFGSPRRPQGLGQELEEPVAPEEAAPVVPAPLPEPLELRSEERWLLGLFFWPLWAFFVIWSFHTKIYANWPAMSYVAGALLGGFALARHISYARGRARKAVKVWIVLGIVAFAAMHLNNYLPLPSGLNPTVRLKGWADLGNELDCLTQNAFDDPDKVFYFSDAYDITAALAFYAPGQPRTYCAYIDRRMNQYDLWPGPTALPDGAKGWGALFVIERFKNHMPAELKEMFDSVQIRHLQTTFRGQQGRKFTIMVCRGFNGHWPVVHTKAF